MSNDTLLDLDSILEESVDNTTSAPDFVEPPNGKYKLSVKSVKLRQDEKKNKETGVMEKKASISAIIVVEDTVEIVDGEVPVPNGSIFSQRWQWTDDGKSYFKSFAEKVLGVEACKGASWKQIMEELPNKHSFNARVTVKKDDKYTNINLNDIQATS